MVDPIATYRIQFHKGFTFKNLIEIIPYLHNLGVSTIYASPIFEATPGSTHGYDVTNPHKINPEIGTLDELLSISSRLKELEMNWIQDIVPNHMAFDQNNYWLMDVLEKGINSNYSSFFDILWDIPVFDGKLMVPFLGGELADVIKDGQLSLTFSAGKFKLSYGGQQYPINIQSVIKVLTTTVHADVPPALSKLIPTLKDRDESYTIPDDLIELLNSKNAAVSKYIDLVLETVNKDEGLLTAIASEQYYQLCYWQDSNKVINYRRFFTVNGLICLNIQDETVFNEYHLFIKDLLDKQVFQGLRVDHIDGLADPKTYLERLRLLAGNDTYIVVEKILENGESFPADWPVQGSTGYDFLGVVNNLLTFSGSKKRFADFYASFSGKRKTAGNSIAEKKAAILYGHMAGELDNLCGLFYKLKLDNYKPDTITAQQIKETIAEFLIGCPVYRFYGNGFPLSGGEDKAVKAIFLDIAANKPKLKKAALFFINLFLSEDAQPEKRLASFKFYQRCMQFTGPLMAKGVEDTLMYTYDRFIAHNEVGDSPEEFGIKVNQFHEYMIERQQKWPLSINATSTHDTKRGEDVRARLNVLTYIPEIWFTQVESWRQTWQQLKNDKAPDSNDEYLIYQTVTGAWPFPGQPDDQLIERSQEYFTKALREAKEHTDWAEPNEVYENATLNFVKRLMLNKAFCESMQQLQSQLADLAVINSLVQTLLKFTCPGIPDVYQGCELWDLSLVDPDNRRPVNYQLRANTVNQHSEKDLKDLWAERYTASGKLWLTNHLYLLRKADPQLFTRGKYVPLQVNGTYKQNVIAYARHYQRRWVIVAAPLHLAATGDNLTSFDWMDTSIILPEDAPVEWLSILKNESSSILTGDVKLSDIFKELPFALFRSSNENKQRGAGIIMHITSLPSKYGIGDLGPGSRAFAEFLSNANQAYWQMLPVNPIEASASFSPYSSSSSMAGNILLISPDDLVADGLLDINTVAGIDVGEHSIVDYNNAIKIKKQLFKLAYQQFVAAPSGLNVAFDDFIKKEQYWLDDFALYDALKNHHHGMPWFKWPNAYKHGEEQELNKFKLSHEKEITEIKWLQFIFFRQWNALKRCSNDLGIQLIGDLPFYISYDSVDVWSNPKLFDLDQDKNIAGIAGVPPDYFNANGQLWGMPVYCWQEHRATGYAWWINRMKRNTELFDLIRLDHFRAFCDFWRVPVNETTAINGEWMEGPGADIFHAFEKEIGKLPFIAEDLGEVNEKVYALRDQFNLPGMNVLQFAFGKDLPVSIHTPHNHKPNGITYTGTHDNNTTLGWFVNDVGTLERNNLSNYLRTKATVSNVNDLMNQLCYSSVSKLAIIPMQDVLHLGAASRMNIPSSADNNWTWRIDEKLITQKVISRLKALVRQYNR